MDMKEKIINAFFELSRIRGFHGITVDELAAHAGVSKRTIYRYFGSKEEIIEAALDSFLARMAREIEHVVKTEKNSLNIITGMVRHITQNGQFLFSPMVLQDLRQRYPHLWRKIDDFRAERILLTFQAIIEGKEQEFRKINPAIATTAFLSSVQAVVNPGFLLDNDLTFEEGIRQLIELFIYGLIKDPD